MVARTVEDSANKLICTSVVETETVDHEVIQQSYRRGACFKDNGAPAQFVDNIDSPETSHASSENGDGNMFNDHWLQPK